MNSCPGSGRSSITKTLSAWTLSLDKWALLTIMRLSTSNSIFLRWCLKLPSTMCQWRGSSSSISIFQWRGNFYIWLNNTNISTGRKWQLRILKVDPSWAAKFTLIWGKRTSFSGSSSMGINGGTLWTPSIGKSGRKYKETRNAISNNSKKNTDIKMKRCRMGSSLMCTFDYGTDSMIIKRLIFYSLSYL